MAAITRFLPKSHLSYIVGKLVHLPLPRFIWTPIIRIFAKAYKINLEEAEFPVEQYPSLGEFFIRKLKPGRRPVGRTWALHPADSVITQAAIIDEGKLIQAKGKHYHVRDFAGFEKAFEIYSGGPFLTYYLCPTDYHRVHSPVDGTIERIIHIPGALWPVNNWSTSNIHELFSINERVYVEIKTDRGLVGVVFVAATNVGDIALSFDPEIRGNQFKVFKPLVKEYKKLSIKKGDELGMFRMGSTIVMLYQKDVLSLQNSQLEQFHNKPVKVNSDFAN
ncbi:archaetidylserine decarboxylase [Pseudobdellovibrio sp. HCB154]|uniref:archaetidylserine decarboxylase n=1 Tax=Pseudobdellovibrio sp. HCB154 TaxID=3386277 RepID=UPI0039171821